MMKRLFTLLLITCFAVVSCTEEMPMPDYSKDHIVLNISNSPMTKAAGDEETAYERQLNRLDCFFYVRGKTTEPCVYYQKVELNEEGQTQVAFYVNEIELKEIIPSGQICDVFVIANYPDAPTFAAKQQGTDIPTLGQKVLDMSEDEYDGIGKPFVMTGSAVAVKGRNSTATADISLKRVASKVTMTVRVPKSLTVSEGVTMIPAIKDDKGDVVVKSSFRHGTAKSYLYGSDFPEVEESHIITEKENYTLVSESEDEYVLKCSAPFYSYSRSWAKGSDHSAYMTLQMPWGIDEDGDKVAEKNINTYYYQILVNSTGRCFERNCWYDMSVNVSVLGSLVESVPKELERLSYYVLDWTKESTDVGTGDRHENVEIQKFNYLEVPQTYIEMNNVSEINIRYNASHKIGVKFTDGEKSVPALPTATDKSAFYINNGSGTPQPEDLTVNLGEKFTDNNKGLLKFTYTLPDDVYSPAYVFITIWLDVNGDGIHDSDEVLTQDVTIVMYPAIYIVGDNSALYSVFVNGNYRQAASKNDYLTINGKQVGKAVGTDGTDPSTYMNVISISAFSEDNYTFVYTNNKKKEYIIGDPRVRSSNKLGVPDENTTTPKKNATGWIKAADVNGTERNLQFYYPTSTEYQVIAPKFRIASKLGGYSECHPEGAALRCASYQEHGFPAGRWRLPTTAEILFIVELQSKRKIKALFYGGNTYFSSTDRVTVNENNNTYTYTLTEGIGNSNASVRCVYDEWYWGSEREAIKNSEFNDSGEYQFTWGDRKVY